MQARMETIKEIEEAAHRREIKQQDVKQAKKLAKLHKLRPEDMAHPGRVIRKQDSAMDIEVPDMDKDRMEAREFDMGDRFESTMSEVSDFTHNPLSECSYVNIKHM